MTGTDRRRGPYPEPLDPQAVHAPDRPKRTGRHFGVLYTCVVLLLLVNVGLVIYVLGRGAYRDAEDARQDQRINDAICDLLDQLPEGGLLERPRAKYSCGPGIPVDQLSPEEQEQIARRGGAPAPSPSPTPRAAPPPDRMGGASPDAPVIVPEPPPTSEPTPPASPSPDPLVDLGPVTDPACTVLPVCPEEAP